MTPSTTDIVDMKHRSFTATTDSSKVIPPSPFVVCIIGASSDIGEHNAYAYGKAGAGAITGSSRQTAELEVVSQNTKEFDPSVSVLVADCDITSAASVAALAETVKSVFGRVDVVIPISGYAGPAPFNVTQEPGVVPTKLQR